MKYNDSVEKIHFKFNSPYDQSREVLVYKNPNNPEMKNALHKTSFNELRGLLVGNAVYIWDANLATHSDVTRILDLEDTKNFIISGDTLLSADLTSEEYFLSKPMIKRMMGLNLS